MMMPANYTVISQDEMIYLDGGSESDVMQVVNPVVTVIGGLVTLSAAGKIFETMSSAGYQPGDVIRQSIENAQGATPAELLTVGLGFASSVWFMVNGARFVIGKLGSLLD